MRIGFVSACVATIFFSASSLAEGFAGAVPEPSGQVDQPVSQLRIRFPGQVIKRDAFRVSCRPAIPGYSGWADNNTIWTYSFKAEQSYMAPEMTGGSRCDVTQTQDLAGADGRIWPAGTLNYSVVVVGPNVTEVLPARGFNNALRETDPVVLILFDGDVDRSKFFADGNGQISYTSANAPAERMPMVAVPSDQERELLAHFRRTHGVEIQDTDKNWILATIRQNLIPGSQVLLTIENQSSLYDSQIRSRKPYRREFSVRGQFQADIRCATPPGSESSCLPGSPIQVVFSGKVKWGDVRDSFIEYIPFKSGDNKVVRSYPNLDEGQSADRGYMDRVLDFVGGYFPSVAKFSDTLVDSISFKVQIEPETQAKVAVPQAIMDIDGRPLTNPIAEFHLRIAAMSEFLRMPRRISFFEKSVPSAFLPVGVVNLNQKIVVRKTGGTPDAWTPVQDMGSIIDMIRAYEAMGRYRETPEYVSPLDQLHVAASRTDIQLRGDRNRETYLQFPFGTNARGEAGGAYVIEVSSPTLEADQSSSRENRYLNPKYTIAQVTDLAVHLKKGRSSTLAWVTRLSDASPVAGAQLEVYNCLGQRVKSVTADNSGLATFANQRWATDCSAPARGWSSHFMPSEFYVSARSGADFTFTHTSWIGRNSFAMGAPGVDYYYSDISENQPHYHAIIGVNLVKPGQKVPIQILAKWPTSHGLAEVPADNLPALARLVSADDDETFYEFPLQWRGGAADLVWSVPSGTAAKLGRYYLELGVGQRSQIVSNADIEVAEFKVPLMTGMVAFPNQTLVRPNALPVNAAIRYANGVGAKNLGIEVSYYFEPTALYRREMPRMAFGTGPIRLTDDQRDYGDGSLPRSSRPARLEGLHTDAAGGLSVDIAQERTADGRLISEVLTGLNRPQTLVARVRYQDQMGEYQTLSQAKDVYSSRQYVGTAIKGGRRNEARLQAATIDVSGGASTSIQDLEFKVMRVETKVIGEQIFGGLIKNTLEREIKSVRWNPTCRLLNGQAECEVGALKVGSYAFEVTSKSASQAAHSFFKVDGDGRVYGPDDFYSFGDEDDSRQLPLALDKRTYRHGEKAVVSFPTPFKSCPALVSLERDDVISSFIVPNACEKGFVEVPVQADFAPNAFVSVYAIAGRSAIAAPKVGERDFGRPTYRLGFANMKVDWSAFKSQVTVATDKVKYEPGETVQVRVEVRPEEGSLAQGGTVTLVALEEKILELKKNDTYAVLEALMQLRGHGVDTVTPLERVETVVALNEDTDKSDRKGGDEGGDGGAKTEFKRKLFDALVSFQSGIEVQNGVAVATFKANDSLTRFKVIAIAMDPNQKFGTGEAVYLTEKETQSYSNIPPIAHAGDRFPARVTVQNNSGRDGRFRAEVTATIKDASGRVLETRRLSAEGAIENAQSATLDAGEVTIADGAARIEYVIRIYDQNGRLVDVMEPDAQNIFPTVPLAIQDSFVAQIEGGVLEQRLVKPERALAEKGEIRATVAKSLVDGALTQVLSRIDRDPFADLFIETRFFRALLKSSQRNAGELTSVLNEILAQTDGAGFVKFFPQSSRGSLWLTASLINALQGERWALDLVPAALAAKWKSSVSRVLTRTVNPDYLGGNPAPMDWLRAQTLMGRAAFVLGDEQLMGAAKAAVESFTRELARNPAAYGAPIESWSNADLADLWLLQAMFLPQSARTSPLFVQLSAPNRLIYTGNSARLKGDPRFLFFYSDETIETATMLLGQVLTKGDPALARTLANGLVAASQKGWYVTSTMMSVMQGLRTFGRAYQREAVNGSALVRIPEQNGSLAINWAAAPSHTLVSPWTGNAATVRVDHSGQGKPWLSVQALAAVPLTAPRGQGLAIDKQIRNLTRESGHQAGDLIEVTLTLNASSSLGHVGLLDPIPAGCNVVGEAYGDYSSGVKSYSGYKLYFNVLPIGATTVKYQYQLNNPGIFKMPPTRAEALYLPGVFGETPNSDLSVR